MTPLWIRKEMLRRVGRPGDAVLPEPPPVNWCIAETVSIDLTNTPGDHTFLPGEVTIAKQSGSDFSIIANPNAGGTAAIVSQSGGRFQCGTYMRANQFGEATLDAGSNQQRYVIFGAELGPADDNDEPWETRFTAPGIDAIIPVLPAAATNLDRFGSTPVSVIGYSAPGMICCYELFATLVNGHGSDVVPWAGRLIIWQV